MTSMFCLKGKNLSMDHLVRFMIRSIGFLLVSSLVVLLSVWVVIRSLDLWCNKFFFSSREKKISSEKNVRIGWV